MGSLDMRVITEGWKFPTPATEPINRPALPEKSPDPATKAVEFDLPDAPAVKLKPHIRPKPTGDTVVFKDRLLYLLQPPLDNLFAGKQVSVPFQPFPYQLEGIAFLMPRHAALLADEMGLGKTAQTILAVRLLFSAGLVKRVLIICPKPLVFNWARELKLWAPDIPFEVFGGDTQTRLRHLESLQLPA